MEHEKTKTVMNVKGLSWRLILGLGALPGRKSNMWEWTNNQSPIGLKKQPYFQ